MLSSSLGDSQTWQKLEIRGAKNAHKTHTLLRNCLRTCVAFEAVQIVPAGALGETDVLALYA